jgi:16S rRNA G1207 methylase RsmC
MWLAKNNPNSKVTAIDSDIAAIRQATENCKNNEINNVIIMPSHGYSDVPPGYKFDLIASNPPTHRGREVVDSMIAQSLDRLNDGGVIVLVVEARIKPWVARQLKEVFGDYKIVKRSPKHVVVMAQK